MSSFQRPLLRRILARQSGKRLFAGLELNRDHPRRWSPNSRSSLLPEFLPEFWNELVVAIKLILG